jgi:hypothetical protein
MATKINMVLDQGTSFSQNIQVLDINGNTANLIGYTGNSEIRKAYTSLNVTASFVVSINAGAGIVILTMDANTSGNINYGRYLYDVKLTDASGNVSRIQEGMITITPQITSNAVYVNTTPTVVSNGNNLLPGE